MKYSGPSIILISEGKIHTLKAWVDKSNRLNATLKFIKSPESKLIWCGVKNSGSNFFLNVWTRSVDKNDWDLKGGALIFIVSNKWPETLKIKRRGTMSSRNSGLGDSSLLKVINSARSNNGDFCHNYNINEQNEYFILRLIVLYIILIIFHIVNPPNYQPPVLQILQRWCGWNKDENYGFRQHFLG